MFIDRTLDIAATANSSLGAQPLAARLFPASASAWAAPRAPRPVEILATISVLALSFLALTGAIAETLAS